MFRVSLNNIYLTRGDTARFNIELVSIKDKSEYELSDADEVYFIVTPDKTVLPLEDIDRKDRCLFYKQGTEIKIEPEDTKDLEEGTYYYHVRVVLGESGDLNTIIEPSDFNITPDIQHF